MELGSAGRIDRYILCACAAGPTVGSCVEQGGTLKTRRFNQCARETKTITEKGAVGSGTHTALPRQTNP